MSHQMKTAARTTTTFPKSLLPFPPEYDWTISTEDIEATGSLLNQTLSSLQVRWMYKPEMYLGLLLAPGNVWSRAARRKKERGESLSENTKIAEPGLGVKIALQLGNNADVKIEIRWVKGSDSVLFESFCGMLKRQLESA